MKPRRVRIEDMRCSERELRAELDRMVERLREVPGRTIGGKIAVPVRIDLDD